MLINVKYGISLTCAAYVVFYGFRKQARIVRIGGRKGKKCVFNVLIYKEKIVDLKLRR